MRDFFNLPIHLVVYSTGRCKKCNTLNDVVNHDYGTMIYRDLEKEMDKTQHYVRPIVCKKCGSSFSPEFFVYKDHLRNVVISKTRLLHGDVVDAEEAERMQEGHQKRFEVFAAHEDEFWRGYVQYALDNWRTMVNELQKEEIEEAYEALGIKEQFNTVQQYRRDVLHRFTTREEKEAFWRAANKFFILEHLLDLGAEAWQVEKDQKLFGLQRIRYAVLHFPLHENLEPLRTKLIGTVVKLDKGDNSFLFRRIAMLTDELSRTKKRLTDYHHQIEKLKEEIAEYQVKLHHAYTQLQEAQTQKQVIRRDPKDVTKIRELKSFIHELMAAVREKDRLIESLQPEAENNTITPVELDGGLDRTKESERQDTVDLSVLEEKTVGIIGGWLRHQDENYPCTVLTHNGAKQDPDFYALLSRADMLVVLTRYVSHAAMWEAKAHAITEDKPILYEQGTNVERILKRCSRLFQEH